MPRRAGLGGIDVRAVLAVAAAVVLALGLAAQAAYLGRDAARAAGATNRDALRSFLVRADRLIPAAAVWASTSPVRADWARYYLYPRRGAAVDFSGSPAAVRARLRRAGVRYVLVIGTAPGRRAFATPRTDWYRTVLRRGPSRLVLVQP